MSRTDESFPVIIAARLSRKVRNTRGEPGIETQDEYSREWCERQGYQVVAVVADFKSGKVAPWDRPHLRPFVTRPDLMSQYKGIVAFKNDRLSRGDWADEVQIRQWASRNGKRLMIVDGPQWPPRHDGDRWQWEANAMQANKEWEEIRERSMRAQKALRDAGKLIGRVPWGYTRIGEKYDRMPLPTEQGWEYVPEAFQRIADGQTCKQVAAWLGSGPLPGISHKTVLRMIRNRFYMGTRLDAHGRPHPMKVPPLVDAKLWTAANRRLDNGGNRGKRGPASGQPALLTSVLFCARCRAPMYRIHPPGRGYWYRCHGCEPLNKGCGNIVPLEATDTLAVNMLSQAGDPWTELHKIEGVNYDAEIDAIRLTLADLPRFGLSDTEEDAERSRLRAERDRLESLPKVEDYWEEIETEQTVGEHFTSLDFDGRRKMMLEDVKFYAERPPSEFATPVVLTMKSRLFRIPVTSP